MFVTVSSKSTLKLAKREHQVREAGLVLRQGSVFPMGVEDGKELSMKKTSIYVSGNRGNRT